MSALLRTARRFTPSLLDIGLPACSQRQLSWWSGKKKVEPVAVKPDDKKVLAGIGTSACIDKFTPFEDTNTFIMDRSL